MLIVTGMTAAMIAEAERVIREKGYEPHLSDGPLQPEEMLGITLPDEPKMKRLAEREHYALPRAPRERPARDWENNRRGRMKPRRR